MMRGEKKRKKILVVDDSAQIRGLIKAILEEEGSEIIEAESAKEGWWKFQDYRPDLVITDLQMETPNAGQILAQKIKMISPDTPLIMVTGWQEHHLNKGEIDYFFLKPFNTEVFKKVVKIFLKKRRRL